MYPKFLVKQLNTVLKITSGVSNERKIAVLDNPTDKKKFVDTIWNPTIGKTANTICNP